MISSVSRVRGTSGRNQVGRLSGSSPWSPTFGTSTAPMTVKAVSATIATSGAGMTLLIRGNPTMTAIPTAIIG